MPNPRYRSWEMLDSHDSQQRTASGDARDALASLQRVRHRAVEGPLVAGDYADDALLAGYVVKYINKAGDKTYRSARDIQFGAFGRWALEGGEDPREEAER